MCNDLFDENEHFLDFEMLKRKFKMNYLTSMGVRQAVLSDLQNNTTSLEMKFWNLLYHLLLRPLY